jgi:hypothetical protein
VKLVDYLGLDLKSDAVLDLIEQHDLEVAYKFDRLREGTPDYYIVSAHAAGFELRFGETQKLEVIWCHVNGDGLFSSVDESLIGVPMLGSITEARSASERFGCQFQFRENVEGIDKVVDWAKLDFERLSWHFEFDRAGLHLITVSAT